MSSLTLLTCPEPCFSVCLPQKYLNKRIKVTPVLPKHAFQALSTVLAAFYPGEHAFFKRGEKPGFLDLLKQGRGLVKHNSRPFLDQPARLENELIAYVAHGGKNIIGVLYGQRAVGHKGRVYGLRKHP